MDEVLLEDLPRTKGVHENKGCTSHATNNLALKERRKRSSRQHSRKGVLNISVRYLRYKRERASSTRKGWRGEIANG